MGFFSRFQKKQTTSWNWRSGSRASFDGQKFRGALRSYYKSGFDLDFEAIRERSRYAYYDSPHARSIIARLTDSTIGNGLSLESSPAWSIIDPTGRIEEEKRHEITREIEVRFNLYAQSKECDAEQRENLYEKQRSSFRRYLIDGEFICVPRYNGSASRQSPLSLQFLPPEQIKSPNEKAGRRIKDGIELDINGAPTAIHVFDDEKRNYTRIPFYGPSGRRFVIHAAAIDLFGQVRGVSILAPIIHELQKITDYSAAELEAAIINAIIVGYVLPSQDANASKVFSNIQLKAQAAGATQAETENKEVKFDRPGLWIQNLKAGEDLKSFDTKRPNVNFGAFVSEIVKNIAASVSIPVEVLEMKFSANYSASRASLILFWQVIEIYRDIFASQFLDPVFEAWAVEESKRLPDLMPGFNDSQDPVYRRAWLNAYWVGPSMPSIDPQKEANADDIRIAQGATTRERVAMKYNGSDFRDNAARLNIENKLLGAQTTPELIEEEKEDV